MLITSEAPARERTAGIASDMAAIDHHSHAAYVRPGEQVEGIVAAEREAAMAGVEARLPADVFGRYMAASTTGNVVEADRLDAEFGITSIFDDEIRRHSTTVYMKALARGARELHGDHSIADLRTLSRERGRADMVGLYDRALEISNTKFVLTDVPSIDHSLWSRQRYRQIVRVDPYLYPFGHPNFAARGSDKPRFRRVFDRVLADQIERNELDLASITFDDYVQFVGASIAQRQRDGAVGLKIASAYIRSLRFIDRPIEQAKIAFDRLRNANGAPEQDDYETLSDFLLYRVAETALSLRLPIQIHVGRGHSEPGLLISDAHPVNLEPLLCTPSLNQLKIVLIHGGFPYSSFLTVLAQTYGNVYVDFSWMSIMHKKVMERTMEEWFEHLPNHKMIFGTDTGSPEFHTSATGLARDALNTVLDGGISSRLWTTAEAEVLAQNALHDNVVELYQLQGAAL